MLGRRLQKMASRLHFPSATHWIVSNRFDMSWCVIRLFQPIAAEEPQYNIQTERLGIGLPKVNGVKKAQRASKQEAASAVSWSHLVRRHHGRAKNSPHIRGQGSRFDWTDSRGQNSQNARLNSCLNLWNVGMAEYFIVCNWIASQGNTCGVCKEDGPCVCFCPYSQFVVRLCIFILVKLQSFCRNRTSQADQPSSSTLRSGEAASQRLLNLCKSLRSICRNLLSERQLAMRCWSQRQRKLRAEERNDEEGYEGRWYVSQYSIVQHTA